jgi:hypothetical protein
MLEQSLVEFTQAHIEPELSQAARALIENSRF